MRRTRDQAIAGGWVKYFTGVACKNGHVAERYVSSRRCCDCCKGVSPAVAQ